MYSVLKEQYFLLLVLIFLYLIMVMQPYSKDLINNMAVSFK